MHWTVHASVVGTGVTTDRTTARLAAGGGDTFPGNRNLDGAISSTSTPVLQTPNARRKQSSGTSTRFTGVVSPGGTYREGEAAAKYMTQASAHAANEESSPFRLASEGMPDTGSAPPRNLSGILRSVPATLHDRTTASPISAAVLPASTGTSLSARATRSSTRAKATSASPAAIAGNETSTPVKKATPTGGSTAPDTPPMTISPMRLRPRPSAPPAGGSSSSARSAKVPASNVEKKASTGSTTQRK
ncbi:hypothetical protein GGD40_006705 [Paraburkholderia bryophila]|uniref:Uncharacterized protein n=1 Tax=Paraburkholderia bryophila TaxID=420952 RepID=A0A7Y9WU28_9BURK|nr:hypothetical protein [Paraburkholderia bryophila]